MSIQDADTHEQKYAQKEAARNAATDSYFEPRPFKDVSSGRDVFGAGFYRAWDEQQARIDQLEKELVEAWKDAKSARAHLAWIAKNIQRPCYRHICDRNGIAEDALAILKRKRSPDDDELFALSEIDKAMETP